MTCLAESASLSVRGPALSLANVVGIIGFVCLATITLASPGATRMFAWPWSLACAGALLAPVLLLMLRAFDQRQPLVLPARAWTGTAFAFAAVVLASALASPHRGPSLLWSAPLLSGVAFFFVAFDALQTGEAHRRCLANLAGLFCAVTVLTSLGLWLAGLGDHSFAEIVGARNPYPLGHSNYTAGFALLALPCLAILAWRMRGTLRAAWTVAAALALATLVTSGSRGGLLGLGALALAALTLAPFEAKKKIRIGATFAVVGLALALAHPRTRAMFASADPAAPPNVSNVQRAAMLTAGWRMGVDRPLLGWGPGITPLVYPRYRAGLDGGAENVLQLHSLPAQLWAELGLAGVACALALAVLAIRAAGTVCHPLDDKLPHLSSETDSDVCHLMDDKLRTAAAIALAGYAVFALTDWQLDVPVFAFAVASCAALLAKPTPAGTRTRRLTGAAVLIALALIALVGRRDFTPEINVRALALARDPTQAGRAAELFRESLALNPDQELVHFNLGWLLVVSDPAAAEKHFAAAAHLVPDKGGVYFGLGLARLNQGRRDDATARALALECLNDPAFLSSPWWREPAIAAMRDATEAEFARLTGRAGALLPSEGWTAKQLRRVAALAPTLGRVPAGAERTYRRERTGYPVLMRNLDLPTPVDLFAVREVTAPVGASLPPKGWLPSPILLQLLDVPPPKPAIPKS
jgi:O-antigen ligase